MSLNAFCHSTFNPEQERLSQDVFSSELRTALSQINERLNRLQQQVQKIETTETEGIPLNQNSQSPVQQSPKLLKTTDQSTLENHTDKINDLKAQLAQIQILKSQNPVVQAIQRTSNILHLQELPRSYNLPVQRPTFCETPAYDLTLIRKPSSSYQNLKKPTIKMPNYSEKKPRLQTIEQENQTSVPKLNLSFVNRQQEKLDKSVEMPVQGLAEGRTNKFQLKENKVLGTWNGQMRAQPLQVSYIQTKLDSSFHLKPPELAYNPRPVPHYVPQPHYVNMSVSPLRVVQQPIQYRNPVQFTPISNQVAYFQPRSLSTQHQSAQHQVRTRTQTIHRY